MKIAAIDIGSNSIHLAVVRAEPGQHLQIIDREKVMARLASKTLRTHSLSEETMGRAVTTLQRFKQLADANGVEVILTTATSAVRESDNAREFVETVREQVGLDVQILPGVEEARLIGLAVSEVTEFNGRRALIIDIGGGSTEFIITRGGEPDLLLSAQLGAVRLTEQIITTDPLSDREYRQLEAHIRSGLARILWEIKQCGFDFVIGTSGTILNFVDAAVQAKAAKEGVTNPAFSPFSQKAFANQLKKLNKKLRRLDLRERAQVPGLDPERADIIVAGGLLLGSILNELGADQLTTCDWSLREGVILNHLRRQEAGEGRRPESEPKNLPQGDRDRVELYSATDHGQLDVWTKSVLSVAKRYNYDATHSQHVARIAAQIFDETSSLHGLGVKERRLLEYAGLLHDIGYYIAHEDHQRHGLYLIKNSEMPGFNRFEIAQIANLVRYIKGKMPRKDQEPIPGSKHEDFFALERAHRLTVKKLTGILRIADALDRTRRQTVRQIRCETRQAGVTFSVECEGDGDLELWMADRDAELFRDVFQVAVRFKHKVSAQGV
jgi:exopolyphosphatase / guanosine-5'-triphosphate,3'-diphosphate pyrophosphatase